MSEGRGDLIWTLISLCCDVFYDSTLCHVTWFQVRWPPKKSAILFLVFLTKSEHFYQVFETSRFDALVCCVSRFSGISDILLLLDYPQHFLWFRTLVYSYCTTVILPVQEFVWLSSWLCPCCLNNWQSFAFLAVKECLVLCAWAQCLAVFEVVCQGQPLIYAGDRELSLLLHLSGALPPLDSFWDCSYALWDLFSQAVCWCLCWPCCQVLTCNDFCFL